MICWKIRIFAYWTTPVCTHRQTTSELWFAEKFVSLLIEQHPADEPDTNQSVVICWKIRIFAYWTTPSDRLENCKPMLWFAEKFVSLLIEQHPAPFPAYSDCSCDLLKNSYLCLLNNTIERAEKLRQRVVICWKIRIFAYWTTPEEEGGRHQEGLWFAEKFVSLLIEQHLASERAADWKCCDLLKNSYLCLLNNTLLAHRLCGFGVVICWKIRIFAYWTTPHQSC